MSSLVALFHATTQAVGPVAAEWHRLAPSVTLLNYVDEGLLSLVKRQGIDSREVADRLRLWLGLMAGDGADAILTTCSSVTPVVARLRPEAGCQLVAIDEPMIAEAVRSGSRIGVVATLQGAAATTQGLIEAGARESDRDVTVTSVVAHGAFEQLARGEGGAHDLAVADLVRRLAPEVDVVVLAQVSMMRARSALPNLATPVLVSAPAAIARILETLEAAVPRPR
jgi:Asp/Glu/hydantoin racemase